MHALCHFNSLHYIITSLFNFIARSNQTGIWQTWERTIREKTERKWEDGRVYGWQCSGEMDRAEESETDNRD